MPETTHPAEQQEPPRDGGSREAARYIKSVVGELSVVARVHRLDLLGYLLEMAQLEADEALCRGQRDPP